MVPILEVGNCLVEARHITASGYKLGKWVSTQRQYKREPKPERIQKLNDFGFVWDVLSEAWEQGFQALVAYKEEYGDISVKKNYSNTSGFSLGRWIRTQRSMKDRLTPARIQRLDELGLFFER
jgi:hypothetical protein